MGDNKIPNKRLKQERERRGWSQEKLAVHLDTNFENVSRWERGITVPQPHFREKLCELFGKDARALGFLDQESCLDAFDNDALHTGTTGIPHEPTPTQFTASINLDEHQSCQFSLPKDQHLVTVQIYQRSLIRASDYSVRNDIITEETQFTRMLGSGDWEREMDRKRRELLRFLSIASGVLLLPFPDLDWERLGDALEKPSHLDNMVIQDFEAINNRYWKLYLASSSKSLVLDGVLGQFKMLVQFLKEPHTTQMHQQLCALSSDLCQLAGEIFFDRYEHDAAKSCYEFAMFTAKEARALDLWASALVRYSFLPLYEEHYGDALPLLKQAQLLAQHGDSLLSTRYWAAAVEAEAASGIGNLAACQDALDRAYGVLDIKGMSPAWLRFDGSRLPALRGACYIRLQEPDLAMSALKEALQQNPTPRRKRGLVLADLAIAAIQQQEIERACIYAGEVIDIVSLGSSSFLHKEVYKLRRQLEPFAETASVRKLDQQLKTLA